MLAKASARRVSCSKSSISSVTSDKIIRHNSSVLLDPPPPSPGLPSLLPHHGKKPPPYHLRQTSPYLLKVVSSIVTIALLFWFVSISKQSNRESFNISYISYNGERHELLGDDYLPKEPMPVALTDHHGRTRWTVYIPQDQDFPLAPSIYADLCSQSEDLAAHVASLAGHDRFHLHKHSTDYYHIDQHFMDIKEAEDHGLLPSRKPAPETQSGTFASSTIPNLTSTGDNLNTTTDVPPLRVCERSLTYVLESHHAGFGPALLGLWLAYGLARHEQRAFFIDDSHWAYGTYSTFFLPPPPPSCSPPPPHHRLPTPHSAPHLLVSAATAPWTYPPSFTTHFSHRHAPPPLRHEPLFHLLRTGHDALFHLPPQDATYLTQRLSQLHATTPASAPLIGVHVRHGDHHPRQPQYRDSHLPLEKYAAAARDMATRLTSPAINASSSSAAAARLVLASDDPAVYSSPVFAAALRAQDRILLAGKPTSAPRPQEAIHRFVDESPGWEGGFYKDVFWGLGSGARRAGGRDQMRWGRERERPSELALQLRGLLGRSYLLDLAVLAGGDGVLCGGGSAACGVLALMAGWEGMRGGRWVDVDEGVGVWGEGGFGWW